jgi:uncharacterized caspase-like protein
MSGAMRTGNFTGNFALLPNPRNDAEDVTAALKRSGFDTISGSDMDKAAMEDAVIRLARAARNADVAVLLRVQNS